MKNTKRIIFVITLLIVFALYMYVSIYGEYLQILGIGQEYVEIFKGNLKQRAIVFAITFVLVYFTTYFTTILVKKGLKKFFAEDKKEFPKLPNKSISLLFAILGGIFCTHTITQKAILAFNSSLFAKSDPIFNLDIGYYIFQKPFIEAIVLYLIGFVSILTLYIAAYYIIVFNRFFDEGIKMETFKKSLFIKQLILNVSIIVILISVFTVLNTQNILFGKFLNISDEISLNGAGLVDVTIRTWGYRIFAALIPICLVIALVYFKKQKIKKMAITMLVIPAYLIVLFLLMVGVDTIYVGSDKLDKEKSYISNNISYTKDAYGINTEEIEIENTGAITVEDIQNNEDVISNINIFNDEVVLNNLEEYQTNLGYYTFKSTKTGLYKIDGKNVLVYISPREILSNDTRTYNSKTYEYTHGYGVIATSAATADSSGYLNYLKNGFTETEEGLNIVEPRIYFGMQTNTGIVVNTDEKVEYDYPLTSTTNTYNTYAGKAGLKLGFLDRLVLGIKEKNLKLAFSGETTEESLIIASRNIIERAKKVMPYLIYDENPYMVITDEGELVWVLDAYTISNQYPYSQKTNISMSNGVSQEINYIRNSAKVLINAYDGTMEFYITDRTDPIIMSYYKMYKDLFQDKDKQLPAPIANHLVYSKFLYDIQAQMLEKYHNVQPEVLYRTDDIWSIGAENTKKLSSIAGTKINSYYTMVKTVDNYKPQLGLVIPYTIKGKQNINSYLVGTYNKENQTPKLTIYKFNSNITSLGTNQLDFLIEQDETISNELKALEVAGSKINKNVIIVPINNKLLYVEPIYQTMLNEKNENPIPLLKKVVVASGNKVAIGNDLQTALKNLLSQAAVSFEVGTDDMDMLINEIIKANKNLEESNASNNWEMIGKDMSKLQELIKKLEVVNEQNKEQKEKQNVVNQDKPEQVTNVNGEN